MFRYVIPAVLAVSIGCGDERVTRIPDDEISPFNAVPVTPPPSTVPVATFVQPEAPVVVTFATPLPMVSPTVSADPIPAATPMPTREPQPTEPTPELPTRYALDPYATIIVLLAFAPEDPRALVEAVRTTGFVVNGSRTECCGSNGERFPDVETYREHRLQDVQGPVAMYNTSRYPLTIDPMVFTRIISPTAHAMWTWRAAPTVTLPRGAELVIGTVDTAADGTRWWTPALPTETEE